MEGNGPSGGTVRHTGCLIASRSPFCLDLFLSRLIALKPQQAPTVLHSIRRGLCPDDPSGLRVLNPDSLPLTIPDFAHPTGYRPGKVHRMRQMRTKLSGADHPHPGAQGKDSSRLYPLLLLPRDVSGQSHPHPRQSIKFLLGGIFMQSITIHSPCKINLSLDIVRRLPNGYHEMDMVMQTVDLCDTLTVSLHTGCSGCPQSSDPKRSFFGAA